MSELVLSCPSCGFQNVVKNGRTRHEKHNYKFNNCQRQFVENPQWKKISEDRKVLINRLVEPGKFI